MGKVSVQWLKTWILVTSIVVYVNYRYLMGDQDVYLLFAIVFLSIFNLLRSKNSRAYKSVTNYFWIPYFAVAACSIALSPRIEASFKVIINLVAITLVSVFYTWGNKNANQLYIKILFTLSFIQVFAVLMQLVVPELIDIINQSILNPDQLYGTQRSFQVGAYAGIAGGTGTAAYGCSVCITIAFVKVVTQKRNRWIWMVVLLVSLIAILLTAKRGPTLACVIAACYVGYSYGKEVQKKIFKLLPLMVIGFVVFLILYLFIPEVSWIFQRFISGSSSGRDIIYGNLWRGFLQHPILGNGFATADSAAVIVSTAHNDYLKPLYETGIVGFVIWMFSLLASFYWTHKNMKILLRIDSNSMRANQHITVIYISFALQIYHMVQSLTDSALSAYGMRLSYMVICAVGFMEIFQWRDQCIDKVIQSDLDTQYPSHATVSSEEVQWKNTTY